MAGRQVPKQTSKNVRPWRCFRSVFYRHHSNHHHQPFRKVGPPLAPEIERPRRCLPLIRTALLLAMTGLPACQSKWNFGPAETGAAASAGQSRFWGTCGAGAGAVRLAIGPCRCIGGQMPPTAARPAGNVAPARAGSSARSSAGLALPPFLAATSAP